MSSNLPGGLLHLIVTAIIGFAYYIIGQLLYPILTENLWQPLGIALYFLGFALVAYATMFILNQIRGDYSFWVKSRKADDWASSYKVGAFCIILIFLLSGVLEFVYEIGSGYTSAATSYIFVIDDSGSMSSNDPSQKRVQAIEAIMQRESQSLPYAVYGFTSDAFLIKDMAPYSSSDSFSFESRGGTDILAALNSVLDDLSSGHLQGGSAPRILLLSDGESSSFGWRYITNDSRSNNATISAVGFGYDSSLLRNIAERTGGVFVQVDDIDDLPTQMGTAITSHASRNLISSRAFMKNDLLYAVMRVVFLSLIGVLWSWMKYETYCSAQAALNRKVFVLSFAFCVLTSLLMELLLQTFWTPPALARMIFCVLWMATPGFFMEHHAGEAVPMQNSRAPWGKVVPGTGGLVGERQIKQTAELREVERGLEVLDGSANNPAWNNDASDAKTNDSPWGPSDSGGDSGGESW